MRTYCIHSELYSTLCGNLNEKETQKRGDVCKHIAVHFAMQRKHNTVKQLYSKTIKKKKVKDSDHFFMCLLIICVSSLENVGSDSLPIKKHWVLLILEPKVFSCIYFCMRVHYEIQDLQTLVPIL